MKRMLSVITISTAVAAGYPSVAMAEDTSQTSESRSLQEQRPQQSASRASGLAPETRAGSMAVRIEQIPGPFSADKAAQLIGMSAVSRWGEKIGEISAVVRSPTDGFLAVVDAGDYFGVRARPVAVPIKPGRIDRNGNLRVQASREELERLPIFATNLVE